MTPKEASEIIGCDVSTVRKMCRDGVIPARTKELPGGKFSYDITKAQAEKARDLPKKEARGYPRGRKRDGHVH